jgi:hypothetical protein
MPRLTIFFSHLTDYDVMDPFILLVIYLLHYTHFLKLLLIFYSCQANLRGLPLFMKEPNTMHQITQINTREAEPSFKT